MEVGAFLNTSYKFRLKCIFYHVYVMFTCLLAVSHYENVLETTNHNSNNF